MGLNVSLPVLVMKTGIAGVIGAQALANWATAIAGQTAPSRTGAPGWLSGDLASAANSATVTCVFDLGPDWQQYGLLQIAIRATAALASINEDASDDGATKVQPLIAANGTALSMTLAAAGDVVASALPSGRYVIITIVNGASAQGATAAVRLTAHPA